MTLTVRRTVPAALAVLALALPALTATQHTHTQADSVWGITAPADPAPAPVDPPAAVPDDSVWG
ncbi:hypothetical protein ABZ404_37005 [Streptomyces sp. NPDC005878]|uniref:hypothetical protein n=1 Tax=Streptomyces sp. NPDC005878 TaxID=3157077 RepID=UPI0033F36EBE